VSNLNTFDNIEFSFADQKLKEWLSYNWGEIIGRHIHLDDGFSIVGTHEGVPVAVISVYWKEWTSPLEGNFDGYIDIIEVKQEFRRHGIARRLIEKAEAICKDKSIYQIRAWSSENKVEALLMWRRLRYAMCPARIVVGQDEIKVNGYYVAKTLE
jgi:GNAT superfamily N-acetyltransferase